MALRLFIVRLAQAGRSTLIHRRPFHNFRIPKNKKIDENNQIRGVVSYSGDPNIVNMCNTDRARIHNELYRVIDAQADEETIRCGEFADGDTVNAVKFAEECTATSCKFADDDTINASKLIDEDTISCAKFSVDEISRAKATDMEFVGVVRSNRASSWTRDYQIILEAVNNDTGEKNLYYAQVQRSYMDEKPFKLVNWMSK